MIEQFTMNWSARKKQRLLMMMIPKLLVTTLLQQNQNRISSHLNFPIRFIQLDSFDQKQKILFHQKQEKWKKDNCCCLLNLQFASKIFIRKIKQLPSQHCEKSMCSNVCVNVELMMLRRNIKTFHCCLNISAPPTSLLI